MKKFAFELGDKVALTLSGEKGEVIGRYEAADHPPQYNVRYVAGDGRQVACWLWSGEIRLVQATTKSDDVSIAEAVTDTPGDEAVADSGQQPADITERMEIWTSMPAWVWAGNAGSLDHRIARLADELAEMRKSQDRWLQFLAEKLGN